MRKGTINAIDKVKVGDIFVNSWGYDQTNIDYFQVTRKTNKTIYIREISSEVKETGFMCGDSTAKKDCFKGEEIRKTAYEYEDKESCLAGNIYVNFDYGCGKLSDGGAESCSWYA